MDWIARKDPVTGYIYLIRCKGFYKIGVATDVHARIGQLQIGCPFQLTLVKAWASIDPIKEEQAIHDLLAQYNIRGEWFKLPKELLVKLLN